MEAFYSLFVGCETGLLKGIETTRNFLME